jgi:thioredoxin 1
LEGDCEVTVAEIPASAFDSEVRVAEGPVVVEFWIRSCGECQRFNPVYEQLPAVFGGSVKFVKINMFLSLENLRLAEDFGVEETPTVKLFCDGKEVGEVVGYRPIDKAVTDIKEILEREKCSSHHDTLSDSAK